MEYNQELILRLLKQIKKECIKSNNCDGCRYLTEYGYCALSEQPFDWSIDDL